MICPVAGVISNLELSHVLLPCFGQELIKFNKRNQFLTAKNHCVVGNIPGYI